MTSNAQKKVKIYKASQELRQRIGSGPLSPEVIENAQRAIDENKIDFTPLGRELLRDLQKALKTIKSDKNELTPEQQKQALTQPVMELKANAALFHYSLIGNLATIMLGFLESIKELDKDAISIVAAHHDTLNSIIQKKMKGDGGEHGKVFAEELESACNRYYKKKKQG